MDFKKFFSAGVAALIFFSMPVTFAAQSANEKLIQIEQEIYGAEQSGAILNRIGQLEKDYSGKNMQGNMNARIEAIYESLYENAGQPSVVAKVNALEWNVNHEVKSEGIKSRLSDLESTIFGTTKSGNLSSRIRELAKASFGSENIPMIQMQLPENTLIKVEMVDSINSRTLQVGDTVTMKVAEDVIIGDKLIFAKGLLGQGTVKSVRKAKGWTGRNGKIDIDFDFIRTIDGNSLETFVGEQAKQKIIDEQMTQGASLIAMDIDNDWSKVLVRGKNIETTAGTQLYIQTKNPETLYVLDTVNNSQLSVVSTQQADVSIQPSASSSQKLETDEVEEIDSAITYLED